MPLRPRTRVARRLRRDATEVEKLFWRALRELESPYRFRRQHPIGRHVVDFACPGLKLAIELDGGQHSLRETEDAARTDELFWNNEAMHNLAGVLETIRQELHSR